MNFRFIIFAISFIFAIAFSLPSLSGGEGKKISLGLDLQGGLHMLLGVKSEVAVESKIKQLASSIRFYCEDSDILLDDLRFSKNSITFTLFDESEALKVKEEFSKESGLIFHNNGLNYTITLSTALIQSTKEFAITQAVDTIRNRLDQFGLAEPTVARQGRDKILVELPGIKSVEEEKRARELIARPANLQLMAVDEDRSDQVYTLSNAKAYEYGDIILDHADKKRKILVKEIPILDGAMLTNATVGFDQQNQPVINFTLNSKGAKIFGDFTDKSVGKRLAVVLDNKVYSAPVIRERIGGGSGQISGGFSLEEAGNVAIALRSGALLAPVIMEEKRSVGPSLGADSIKASFLALISGFVLVVLFMIYYYGSYGLVSNIALITNLFLIIAIMALFGATLTLPGMAGIVLTVGMAVDANVIINERIKELLNKGVSLQKAIEDGYKNAVRAILDANITTLIVAVILFAYGSGPIKGFALTISIGILASMLTAIIGTHGVYDMLISKLATKGKNSFCILKSWGFRDGIFAKGTIYNFMGKRGQFLAISALLVSISIASLGIKGLHYGIDFEGGSVIQIQYKTVAPIKHIREKLSTNIIFEKATITEFGSPNEVLIKVSASSQNVSSDIGDEVRTLLVGTGEFEVRRVDMVGPKVGGELREKGLMALLLSLVAILIYVGYRFEIRFAFAAILALMHDVLISVGALVLLGIDVNLEILAAILTILGYSLNDTIIVFDRIREQIQTSKLTNLTELINEAISLTLSRTTLTSLTTFFVVLTLYLFGGEILSGFSFTLLVGVIVGTYSSIFIASTFLLLLNFSIKNYRQNEAEKLKKEQEKAKMRAQFEQGVM